MKAILWWQYLDDIFMLWQHGEKKLERFLEFLNNSLLPIIQGKR